MSKNNRDTRNSSNTPATPPPSDSPEGFTEPAAPADPQPVAFEEPGELVTEEPEEPQEAEEAPPPTDPHPPVESEAGADVEAAPSLADNLRALSFRGDQAEAEAGERAKLYWEGTLIPEMERQARERGVRQTVVTLDVDVTPAEARALIRLAQANKVSAALASYGGRLDLHLNWDA